MPGSRNRSDLVLRRHYRESRFLAQIFGMSRNATRYVFSVHAPHLVPRTLRVIEAAIVKGTTFTHVHKRTHVCMYTAQNYFKVTSTIFEYFLILSYFVYSYTFIFVSFYKRVSFICVYL